MIIIKGKKENAYWLNIKQIKLYTPATPYPKYRPISCLIGDFDFDSILIGITRKLKI